MTQQTRRSCLKINKGNTFFADHEGLVQVFAPTARNSRCRPGALLREGATKLLAHAAERGRARRWRGVLAGGCRASGGHRSPREGTRRPESAQRPKKRPRTRAAVVGGGSQARGRLGRGGNAAAVAFGAVWKRLLRFKGYVAGQSPLVPYINGKGVRSSGPLKIGFSADLFTSRKHVQGTNAPMKSARFFSGF